MSAAARETPETPLAWLRRFVASAFAVACLIGVAVWGHTTDWQFGWHHSRSNSVGQIADLASIHFGPPISMADKAPGALKREVALAISSAEAVEKAGIDVAPVWTAPVTD